MLSYQHAYHAGNPADVLKHSVLCWVLQHLCQKDKPFYCHDTHAGRGMYWLDSQESQKTGEHAQGISTIWQQPSTPAALQPYLDSVAGFNGNNRRNALRRYPGSPLLMQRWMREGDRLGCTELHPQEYLALKKALPRHRRIRVAREEGYHALSAALPPLERRALVLLDPSYELASDDAAVIQAVQAGLARCAHGIFMVWYPLVNAARTRDLLYKAERVVTHNLLRLELQTRAPTSGAGMYGSGMLIYNPPWQLDEAMSEALPWLTGILAPEVGSWRVSWMRPAT